VSKLSVRGATHGFGDQVQPIDVSLDVTRLSEQPHRPARAAGGGWLRWGDILSWELALAGANQAELRLTSTQLSPALMRSLVPSWPLKVTAALAGKVGVDSAGVAVDVALTGAPAEGFLRASGDVSLDGARSVHGLRLEIKDVRLSSWMSGVSATPPLALQLAVEPGRLSPDALTGAFRLDVPRALFRGQAAGPLHLAIDADNGALSRLDGRVPLPGALVTADGKTAQDTTIAKLNVALEDLGALQRAIAAWTAPEVATMRDEKSAPPTEMAGHGNLALTVVASRPDRWRDATVKLSAAALFPTLRSGTTELTGLSLEAEAPTVTRARQVLHLDLRLQAPVPVRLQAGASLAEGEDGPWKTTAVELSQLDLDYPGARWRLGETARARMAVNEREKRTRTTLADFIWHDERDPDGAALTARAEVADEHTSGEARLHALNLARLPLAALLDGPIEGKLEAGGTWSGPRAHPEAKVDLTLKEAGFGPVHGVDAKVDAALAQDRTVDATLAVDAPREGHLRGSWKGKLTDGPIEAKVDVTDVVLEHLPLPSPRARVAGRLAAHLGVDGTLASPHAALRIEGKDISLTPRGLTAEDVRTAGVRRLVWPTITAELAYRDPRLDVRTSAKDARGGKLRVAAHTTIALAELRQNGAAMSKKLAHRALRGTLKMEALDPAGLALFVPALRRVEGRLSATLDLIGTVSDPSVRGKLDWKKGGVITARDGSTPPHDEGQHDDGGEAAPAAPEAP